MPCFYYAFATEGTFTKTQGGTEVLVKLVGSKKGKLVDNSLPRIKNGNKELGYPGIKDFPNSRWTIAYFRFDTPNIPIADLLQLLRDPTQLEPFEVFDWRVNETGRISRILDDGEEKEEK